MLCRYSQDLKWKIVWNCFYRNTSCEETAETLFISVRTVASSQRYLLTTPKWGQGSEVSRESNDNRDIHFANRCNTLMRERLGGHFSIPMHTHSTQVPVDCWLPLMREYIQQFMIAPPNNKRTMYSRSNQWTHSAAYTGSRLVGNHGIILCHHFPTLYAIE